MASQTDPSSSLLEAISESTSLEISRRKNRLNIHNFCHTVSKDKEYNTNRKRLYYCNLCSTIAKSTTNFRSHYHNTYGI